VIERPLSRKVQRHLGKVVGDDGPARDVDDRGDRDAFRIAGKAGEIRVLQTRNLKYRVDAVGVEVECPAALVVRRAAKPNRQNIFQAE
jgi:hypothetical protein